MSDKAEPGGRGSPGTRDRRRDIRLVLIGIAAVLLIWFALTNLDQNVTIHFWVFTAKTRPLTVILVSVALGALIGFLLGRRRKAEH